MEALETARAEKSRITAAERFRVAFRHNVLAGADIDIHVGDLALCYREKPIGRWVAAFLVIGREGPLVRLGNGDKQAMDPVDQIKRYMERTPSFTVNRPELLPHVVTNVEQPHSYRSDSHTVLADPPVAPSQPSGSSATVLTLCPNAQVVPIAQATSASAPSTDTISRLILLTRTNTREEIVYAHSSDLG